MYGLLPFLSVFPCLRSLAILLSFYTVLFRFCCNAQVINNMSMSPDSDTFLSLAAIKISARSKNIGNLLLALTGTRESDVM